MNLYLNDYCFWQRRTSAWLTAEKAPLLEVAPTSLAAFFLRSLSRDFDLDWATLNQSAKYEAISCPIYCLVGF